MEPDGFLRIVDRKKDLVLVSGFNVYPNEVEDALAKMDAVLEAAVVPSRTRRPARPCAPMWSRTPTSKAN